MFWANCPTQNRVPELPGLSIGPATTTLVHAALKRFDKKAGISLRGISGDELPLRT